VKVLLRNCGVKLAVTAFKRTRAREEIQALVQRRIMKILPARSTFLYDVFLLAQEGMSFLFCIHD
jgi:hypothetical protein